jgi:uncharacterized protein
MKISVIAKPNRKKECVEQIDSTHYIVSVTEPAQKGRANQAIINSLSKYFNVHKSQLTIVLGETTKTKVFEVPDFLKNFEEPLKQKRLI